MLSHGKRAFYRKIFHFNDVELKMSLRPQKTSKFNNQKFTKFNYRNRKIQPKFSNFFLNFDNLKMRRQMKIERDWECVTYILTTNWEATQILIKVSQMFTQNIDFIIKEICFALHFRSMSLNDVFLISIFSLIHRITVEEVDRLKFSHFLNLSHCFCFLASVFSVLPFCTLPFSYEINLNWAHLIKLCKQ